MKSLHIIVRRTTVAECDVEVDDADYELLRKGEFDVDEAIGFDVYTELQRTVDKEWPTYDYRFEDEDGEVVLDFDGPDIGSNYLY